MRLDVSQPYDEVQGLCEVAGNLVGAPIALVTLIDKNYQTFLASVGVGEMKTTDREDSFCTHTIMESEQLEVADTHLDERFFQNPFVVGETGIRSYLGTVLEPEPEMRIGALCVLDTKTKTYSAEEKACLSKIAKAISALLLSHRENLDLAAQSEKLTAKNAEANALTISLQKSMEKLVYAENVKNEFLSVITHEIRTPLTSIMGSVGLLQTMSPAADPEKTQRLMNIAHESSGRLLALVNDILDLQRNNFTTPDVKFAPVDLSEVIEDSIKVYRSYAKDKDVTLTVSAKNTPCIVRANKELMIRAVSNILSNAVKFSQRGGDVEINLGCLDDGAEIRIKDSGVGIPEGSQDKVFGLFTQLDSSDTRKSQRGTGLGLYMCKKILNQHNATINYESTPDVGTTFVVKFPIIAPGDDLNQAK
jgi:signal transduction histidine kinase